MSISAVPGVRSDISEILSKIREVSNKSKVFSTDSSSSSVQSFDSVLSAAKNAISHVGQLQAQSEQVKNAYVTGDHSVSMAQVVIATQKSKLAFEGLVSVRNKILEAYKEIMNMQV